MRAKETRRSAWALSDQAIVSLGNFVTTGLMIRSLGRAEFGRFGICFEVMLYLNSLQASVVTYPLTVRGAVADELRLKRLATACLFFTALTALPLALGMAAATKFLGRFQFAPWAIAALLLWQIQETLRRALLSHFRYGTALPGDFISYAGQAIAMAALAATHRLTLGSAFAAMACTSAAAGILQAFQLGLAPIDFSEIRALAADFWSFGRWSLLSNIASAFTDFSFDWLLAAARGLDLSAAFQVMGHLTRPCNTVMNAIPGVATPAAARARKEGGFNAGWRAAIRYYALGAAVMAPYVLFLTAWPQGVMRIFYGQQAGSYTQYANAARINIIALILGYIANGLATYLAAMEETRYNFIASVINTAAVFIVGLPLTYYGGLYGTIWGCIICVSVRLVCNVVFVQRVRSRPERVEVEEPTHAFPVIMPGPAAEADLATAEAVANVP